MTTLDLSQHRLGWIGTGRMGYELAGRLIDAGADVAVYNRTRAKAEPLAARGATLVDRASELADRDIVFTMVAASDDLIAVTLGRDGVLTGEGAAPRVLVDCSTVSEEASREVRAAAAKRSSTLLAAPISGNPKVVQAGRASVVVSGPQAGVDEARRYLAALGHAVTHVGDGDAARLVKIAHNLMLGIVAQALAEVTVLVEQGGVPRTEFLAFLNDSVMGSAFTRYKTPALVTLDLAPTFTPTLLRKDLDLGLAAADALNATLPLTTATRERVQALIDDGKTDIDFAALLLLQAKEAGLELQPEPGPVSDGLESIPGTPVRS